MEIIPIGVPVAWPSDTAPYGWLFSRGQAFDMGAYPALALAYPTGVLPDLRGHFIRGLDNGLGVDVGRVALTSQNSEFLQHKHGQGNGCEFPQYGYTGTTGTRHDSDPSTGELSYSADALTATSATNAPVVASANETRPINVAFNYIVRAF